MNNTLFLFLMQSYAVFHHPPRNIPICSTSCMDKQGYYGQIAEINLKVV